VRKKQEVLLSCRTISSLGNMLMMLWTAPQSACFTIVPSFESKNARITITKR
jgi:hypothetical protein